MVKAETPRDKEHRETVGLWDVPAWTVLLWNPEAEGVCPSMGTPVLPWTALESHFKLAQESLNLRVVECVTYLFPLLVLSTQEMEKPDVLTHGWGR